MTAGHTNCSFPDLPHKLLKLAAGPSDARNLGYERYYDMTPAQRAASLPKIVQNSSFGTKEDKIFARGWLDALQLARAQAQGES